MSKNSKRKRRKLNIWSIEDAENFDNDFDLDELSRDIYSTEWGNDQSNEGRLSARRKIERRKEQRQLYSELSDWEEFGLDELD